MRRTKAGKGWRARRNGDAPVPLTSLIPASWIHGARNGSSPLASVVATYLAEIETDVLWVQHDEDYLVIGARNWGAANEVRRQLVGGGSLTEPSHLDDIWEVLGWIPGMSIGQQYLGVFKSIVLAHLPPMEALAYVARLATDE